MSRHFRLRLLSVITLLVMILVSGFIWKGYAGIEPGPFAPEVLPKPKLRGKLIGMFNGVDTAAFTFVGTCKNEKPYILGPLFFSLSPSSFAEVSDPEILEGFLISNEDGQFVVPPGCFSEDDFLAGFVVDQVKKYTISTPTLIIVEIVMLGFRF